MTRHDTVLDGTRVRIDLAAVLRLAHDPDFGRIAKAEDEGGRIAGHVGPRSAMLMRYHGVTTLGATVAGAYDAVYLLERAARTILWPRPRRRKGPPVKKSDLRILPR